MLLPGCGGGGAGKPIPKDQANRMNALIALADQESSAGRCASAQANVRKAQTISDQIPHTVGRSLRQGIADGLGRLNSLILSECQAPQPTTTTPTTTTPSTTTPTTTTPSTTTPTTTTPSTTTPTTTTPSTTTPTTTAPSTTTPTTTTGNGGTPTVTGATGTPPGQ